MRQRTLSLDVLKGLAILLVVLGHVYRSSLRGAPSLLEDTIYSVHMPLFVLVSGYLATRPIDWSWRGIFRYWRGKILRLLLPLCFIAEVAQVAAEGRLDLPLRSMVGGYWFTYALFLIFGVFFLVQGLALGVEKCYRMLGKMGGGKKEAIPSTWVSLVLLLSIPLVELVIAWLYGFNSRLCNGFLLYKIAHLYKYFLLGYFMALYPKLDSFVRKESTGAAGFFLFALLFLLQRLGYSFWGSDVLTTLSGLTFIYSATRYAVDGDQAAKPWVEKVAYLGRLSLAIYFIHYFFLPDLPLLRAYEQGLSGDPLMLFAFQAIVGLVVGALILVPTMLLVWITRSNRYLRYFLYGEPR